MCVARVPPFECAYCRNSTLSSSVYSHRAPSVRACVHGHAARPYQWPPLHAITALPHALPPSRLRALCASGVPQWFGAVFAKVVIHHLDDFTECAHNVHVPVIVSRHVLVIRHYAWDSQNWGALGCEQRALPPFSLGRTGGTSLRMGRREQASTVC